MSLFKVLVHHILSPKNESCYAFPILAETNVIGKLCCEKGYLVCWTWAVEGSSSWIVIILSYDGFIFHNHADSKTPHYHSTLAELDGAPLALGGWNPNNNKAETFDIQRNTWNEVAPYPYFNAYV